MKKRIWLVLSLTVLAAMVVSACGPAATTEAPQPTSPPVDTAATEDAMHAAETEAAGEEMHAAETEEAMHAAETEAAAPTQPAVAELIVWADAFRAPVIEEIGATFEEEFGVKISVVALGFGDIRDQMKVAAPAGEGPDIIIGAHDWLGELVTNGLLAPIDLGDKADLFAPEAIQAFTYEGELYGMPYAIENIALFRNTDLVPDAPETWTEVIEIATELEDAGTVTQGYVLQQGDPYHFFPIQTAFGGYVFGQNSDGTYNPDDVGIDSEGSLAAAEWLDTMVKEGHLKEGVDGPTMVGLFESGQAAMIITGPWSLTQLRDSGVPYAISPIPDETGEGRPFLGVQGFMVSAFSKDPLLAQTFLLEFVATEEVMSQLYIDRPPAFLPVVESLDDPDLAAFGEAGVGALPMPAIPEMSAVWTAWGDAVTLIFQQQSAPDEAFQNAAQQIRDAIAEQ